MGWYIHILLIYWSFSRLFIKPLFLGLEHRSLYISYHDKLLGNFLVSAVNTKVSYCLTSWYWPLASILGAVFAAYLFYKHFWLFSCVVSSHKKKIFHVLALCLLQAAFQNTIAYFIVVLCSSFCWSSVVVILQLDFLNIIFSF